MSEQSQRFRQISVVVRRFAGEAVQNIPPRRNVKLGAPFQELHILDRHRALPHQLENARVEALDAGLNFPDAGGPKQLNVITSQVRLYFIEDLEVDVLFG